MPEVIDHLAELTGFRDRDVVDVTLVGAFRDLLRPECVAIYRPVGEGGGQQRWLTRARQRAQDSAASADSIWADMDDLPALAALPLHQRCLQQQAAVRSDAEGQALSLFPLATERDAGGVLELRTREPLTPEQTRLVCSMLRVYRNFQGLLDYSERDTLTGLLNRTTFDGSFLRLAAPGALSAADADAAASVDGDARRAAVPEGAWLGVVDIDHFKAVNDSHGHLIGDEVLLLIARLMRSSFRFHDLLYRFGGEEFVVLMRGGQAAQAVAAFERLRANVAHYVFPRVGRITVSIGFTEVRAGDSPAAAFERADRAVYFAKQNGRDQVAPHDALIARGLLVDRARTGDMELF
ncbi:MAG: GGDEF domain-containing protein [Rubrivivax sp.]